MKSSGGLGRLVISIDLGPGASDGTVAELAKMLHRHQFPATWCSADPLSPAVKRVIGRDRSGHELALFAGPDWTNSGRGQFSRELTQQLNKARAAGQGISSLVFAVSPSPELCEVAVRQGITAVRSSTAEPPRGWWSTVTVRRGLSIKKLASLQPRLVRYGMWDVPAMAAWPAAGRIATGAMAAIRRGMQRALATGSVYHLVIDAAALAQGGPAAADGLDRLLEYAAKRRSNNELRISTLASLTASLAPVRSQPARSILKREAA